MPLTFLSGQKPSVPTFNARHLFFRPTEAEAYSSFDARLLRYDIFWAFYESTQYFGGLVTPWAIEFRKQINTYRHTRPLFKVGYRLGEFYATHLLGGHLDSEAGNGAQTPTALPIITDDDRIRTAIAQLWKESRWEIQKDVLAREGSIKGDVGIEIMDDFAHESVWLRVWGGEAIHSIDKDDRGNVTGVTIVKNRPSPDGDIGLDGQRKWAVYTKTMNKRPDGGVDVFVYKDDALHNWGEGPPGNDGSWVIDDYDFVPFVHIEHKPIGQVWGESELKGPLMTIAESDAIASDIADWLYKSLLSPWLFTGINEKEGKIVLNSDSREDVPTWSTPAKEAKAHSLIGPLPVADASGYVSQLINELEKAHPELRVDNARASGDMSGKSLREARKPAEKRINSRRAGYDFAIVRAQQMAITIGGIRNRAGFEPFDEGSFESGELEHQIGHRNVFDLDVFDRIEQRTSEFLGIQSARQAGFTLEDAMKRFGATEEEIRNAVAERDANMPQPGQDQAQAGREAQFTSPPDPMQSETRPVLNSGS